MTRITFTFSSLLALCGDPVLLLLAVVFSVLLSAFSVLVVPEKVIHFIAVIWRHEVQRRRRTFQSGLRWPLNSWWHHSGTYQPVCDARCRGPLRAPWALRRGWTGAGTRWRTCARGPPSSCPASQRSLGSPCLDRLITCSLLDFVIKLLLILRLVKKRMIEYMIIF